MMRRARSARGRPPPPLHAPPPPRTAAATHHRRHAPPPPRTAAATTSSTSTSAQVWEGDEYGAYHGRLHGEVLLLFEGGEPPAAGAEPSEAILLHGCHTEDVDGDDGAFELSIADADGETFSLNFDGEGERTAWREAIDGRSAPPAIAHAAHILIKHRGSRRLASWRDPDGSKIKLRSAEEAVAMLEGHRRDIKAGRRSIQQIAEEVSDCDTATHGGDLGWFAAGYMQPEFEEATLALAVGELSDVVTTASGCHLILRVG